MVGHDQDWFFGKSLLEFFKGYLSFRGPFELLVFLKKFIHRFHHFRVFPDKSLIKVSKSKE